MLKQALLKGLFAGSLLLSCLRPEAQVPDQAILHLRAPGTFKARFTTTKGVFVIEVYRNWSPLGADRLYQLIRSGFYNNSVLFRVQRNYVIQFGIANNPKVNRFWDARKLRDEPAKFTNRKGVISFARDGANNRATQLFINMADNPKLDTIFRNGAKGYIPVARVVKGMEVAASFYDAYGRTTLAHQDSVYLHGNQYFYQHFRGLDKIIVATILE